MASVIVVKGRSRGNYMPLKVGRTVALGRDEACDLQVQGDEVSRRHLLIRGEAAEGHFTAIDAHSVNGVYVNDVRITEETPLRDGDRIVIGDSELLFTQENFLDRESALNFFQRGEHDRSTMMKGGRDEDRAGG